MGAISARPGCADGTIPGKIQQTVKQVKGREDDIDFLYPYPACVRISRVLVDSIEITTLPATDPPSWMSTSLGATCRNDTSCPDTARG